MSSKTVSPSITAASFNCPHCGALADQEWFESFARALPKPKTPFRVEWSQVESSRQLVTKSQGKDSEPEAIATLNLVERLYVGEVVLLEKEDSNYVRRVGNLTLSVCRSCARVSVWIYDKVVYPPTVSGIAPNEDLPPDILRDFQEARQILDLSPRGAAALLRLCIQKLCAYLGEDGKNLNADIGKLVSKGLDARVQKALDTVRVVGNESVHPGQLDMRDNRDVALSLFRLVNLIAEKTITEPKHVSEVYEALVPAATRSAIERRDKSSAPESEGDTKNP